MPTFTPPAQQLIQIAGPVGSLEAILEEPSPMETAAAAVICHPNPQAGGTMRNKVVHMLARTFHERGYPTMRFNYRGVGHSVGTFDEGRGETDDALAVLRSAGQRWPGAALWLGGFSFGGAVAIRAALQRPVAGLVTVAPAVSRIDAHEGTPLDVPDCPWLVVQGDQDEVIASSLVGEWVAQLGPAPHFILVPGVGHYFHGALDQLRGLVGHWLESQGLRTALAAA